MIVKHFIVVFILRRQNITFNQLNNVNHSEKLKFAICDWHFETLNVDRAYRANVALNLT